MMHCRSRIQNMVVLLNETVWSRKLHSDVCHELLHVLSGRMSIECADGRCFPLSMGETLLIPAGLKHRDVFNPSREVKLQLIHFSLESSDEYFTVVSMRASTRLGDPARSEINGILARMRNDLNPAEQTMNVNECRLDTILQLIYREADGLRQGVQPLRNPARLGLAIRHYMECNYSDRNMSLSSVAEHFQVSRCHLSRLFHEESGSTFVAYLSELRMREAERLLRDTYRSVAEVAYAVGYANPNYFARVFQRRNGVPPSSYRENTYADVHRKLKPESAK